MYNQDAHLCVMCDDEPAVYRGLCATCLYDSEFEESVEDRRVKPLNRRGSNYEENYRGD